MASKILMSFRRFCTTYRQSNRSSINNTSVAIGEAKSTVGKKIEMIDVCIPLGIALTALMFGAYTGTGQLSNLLSMRANKKVRDPKLEVEKPDQVVDEGN